VTPDARVRSHWKLPGLVALLAMACVVPFWLTDFQLFRITNVLIYAIALLGMNILVGYNGQISLGHGAFYAIGAYTSALLVVHLDIAHWATVPIAGALCLIVGFVFSLPLLRLEPMHLAMATFAVGAVLPQIAKLKGIDRWTGGGQGMGIDEPAVPFGLPLSFDQWLYLMALLTLALSFVFAANLLRGRIGKAIVAIRDDAIAAQSMGIDTALTKATVFGISAMLTGIAGALAALSIRYVGPGMFGVFLSFGLLIGIAVGGLASLSGALYGAIFMQFILLAVGATAHSLQTSQIYPIYGIALILFLCVNPHGVAGWVDWAWGRARRLRLAGMRRDPS
jgi:branched-chain amino acid transport system permease protein